MALVTNLWLMPPLAMGRRPPHILRNGGNLLADCITWPGAIPAAMRLSEVVKCFEEY
jgi:hypothetical protein